VIFLVSKDLEGVGSGLFQGYLSVFVWKE